MRQRVDLPESVPQTAPRSANAEPDAAALAQAWPREAVNAQRLRDAEVARAQATLKRELVRVYAQACGADRPKA